MLACGATVASIVLTSTVRATVTGPGGFPPTAITLSHTPLPSVRFASTHLPAIKHLPRVRGRPAVLARRADARRAHSLLHTLQSPVPVPYPSRLHSACPTLLCLSHRLSLTKLGAEPLELVWTSGGLPRSCGRGPVGSRLGPLPTYPLYAHSRHVGRWPSAPCSDQCAGAGGADVDLDSRPPPLPGMFRGLRSTNSRGPLVQHGSGPPLVWALTIVQ